MDEAFKLTYILLIYFALGAGLTFKINSNKTREAAFQSWLKYLVYLGMTFLLFAIICYFNSSFELACLWIILIGFYELIRLEIRSHPHHKQYFTVVLILFSVLSWLFYSFSLLDRILLLITFFTVSSFDAFSQMIGQMFGRSKIAPQISPGKTVEGFIGGSFFAVLTALLIGNILKFGFVMSLFWGITISISSFAGDLAASVVKRKYQIKDFSRLIPGHGGCLDRFDSLIFTGAMVYLLTRLI